MLPVIYLDDKYVVDLVLIRDFDMQTGHLIICLIIEINNS